MSLIARLLTRADRCRVNIRVSTWYAYMALLLPFCAYAAVSDFNDQFKGYTVPVLLSLGSLILCGTVTGMLYRLKNEYMINGVVRHPVIFVASDLGGGIFAGVLVAIATVGNNFPSWGVASLTGVASFGGSLVIEYGWQVLAKRYLPGNPDTKLGHIVASVKGPTRTDEPDDGDRPTPPPPKPRNP